MIEAQGLYNQLISAEGLDPKEMQRFEDLIEELERRWGLNIEDLQFGGHNAACPFCGSESLKAHVVATVTNVPLGSDGFALIDGDMEETDIISIWCVNCGTEEIPVDHYFFA